MSRMPKRGQSHVSFDPSYYDQEYGSGNQSVRGGNHYSNRGGRGRRNNQQQPKLCYLNADFLSNQLQFQSQSTTNFSRRGKRNWNGGNMGNTWRVSGNAPDFPRRTGAASNDLEGSDIVENADGGRSSSREREQLEQQPEFEPRRDNKGSKSSRRVVVSDELNDVERNRRARREKRKGRSRSHRYSGPKSKIPRYFHRERSLIHSEKDRGNKKRKTVEPYKGHTDSNSSDEDEQDLRITVLRQKMMHRNRNLRREPGEIIESEDEDQLNNDVGKTDVIVRRSSKTRGEASTSSRHGTRSGSAQSLNVEVDSQEGDNSQASGDSMMTLTNSISSLDNSQDEFSPISQDELAVTSQNSSNTNENEANKNKPTSSEPTTDTTTSLDLAHCETPKKSDHEGVFARISPSQPSTSSDLLAKVSRTPSIRPDSAQSSASTTKLASSAKQTERDRTVDTSADDKRKTPSPSKCVSPNNNEVEVLPSTPISITSERIVSALSHTLIVSRSTPNTPKVSSSAGETNNPFTGERPNCLGRLSRPSSKGQTSRGSPSSRNKSRKEDAVSSPLSELSSMKRQVEFVNKELKIQNQKIRENEIYIAQLERHLKAAEEKDKKIKTLRGMKTQIQNELETCKKNLNSTEKKLKDTQYKLDKAEKELKARAAAVASASEAARSNSSVNEGTQTAQNNGDASVNGESSRDRDSRASSEDQLIIALAYQDRLFVEIEKVKTVYEMEVMKLQHFYEMSLQAQRNQAFPGHLIGIHSSAFPKGCVMGPTPMPMPMNVNHSVMTDQQGGNNRQEQQQLRLPQPNMFAHLGPPDSVAPPIINLSSSLANGMRARVPLFLNRRLPMPPQTQSVPTSTDTDPQATSTVGQQRSIQQQQQISQQQQQQQSQQQASNGQRNSNTPSNFGGR